MLTLRNAWALLAFSFCSVLHPAHALIGQGVAPGGLDQSCSILILRTTTQELCTGTLTEKQLVTTAKHCLTESEKNAETIRRIVVRCGYLGSQLQANSTMRAQFAEEFEVTEYRLAVDQAGMVLTDLSVDLAQLILPRESKFEPLARINKETFRSMVFSASSTTQCRVEGYGENNQGRVLELQSAPVWSFAYDSVQYKNYVELSNFFAFGSSERAIENRDEVSSWFPPQTREQFNRLFRFLRRYPPEKFVITSGDSGGGLYCRTGGEDTPWQWVGAMSGGSLSLGRFDPTNEFKEDLHFLDPNVSNDGLRSRLEPGERWDLQIVNQVVIGDQVPFENSVFLEKR